MYDAQLVDYKLKVPNTEKYHFSRNCSRHNLWKDDYDNVHAFKMFFLNIFCVAKEAKVFYQCTCMMLLDYKLKVLNTQKYILIRFDKFDSLQFSMAVY